MRYFPVFIDLDDQKVVVIGGGETAAQKVRLLLKTNARVVVIAPQLTPELRGFAAEGKITAILRKFKPADLDSARLVYATTGNATIDRAISHAAHKLSIPVNVVDDPVACSFITPAIVDRSPVVIAVSTEGAAPVLAREMKSKLEAMLPVNFGALATFAARLRPIVARHMEGTSARRRFWQRFFKSRARKLILDGHEAAAWKITGEEIDASLESANATGRVSLVGVGPGDPDLLTLKAQRLLQEADVIVLDGLVNPDILEYARRDARRLYVGKTPGHEYVKQSGINAVMAREALAGSQVLRLQGGDNLHFARDIEALKPLAQLGIETEIIPGVGSQPLGWLQVPSKKLHTQAVST